MPNNDDDKDDGGEGDEKCHYCQVSPVVLDIPWRAMVTLRPVYRSPGDKTMLCQPLKTQ